MPDAEAPTPLAGVFPPRLVARLHRERFEGTLRLHGGGAVRVIYFRRGEIASAASNAEEDRLPNILIREGRLTGPQVEMARAKQRPGVSLGKTLIELGFLTPAELLQGARRQVRQILAAAFTLRDGTSQQSPGPLPPEVTVLGLPVRRLIFDALIEAGDRQTVVQEMGSMETVYRPSADLETGLPTLRLEPQHEEVARLVDGQATLREISGRVRLDDLTVSKIVLALEILGLVEQETPRLGTGGGRRIPVIVPEEAEDEPPMKVASEPWPAGGAGAGAFEPEPPPAGLPTLTIAPPPTLTVAPPPTRAVAPPLTVAPPVEAAPIAAVPPVEATPPVAAGPPPVAAPRPAAALSVARPAASAPYAPSWAQSSDEPDDSESAIAFEEEAETPPIPPGELPAFAAPPNVPTGWSVDPETGEKVHLGPVELTFDGPVVPPQQHGAGRGRLALLGAAGLLVVGALVVWFVVRGDNPPDTSPAEIAARATGATPGPGTEGQDGSLAPAGSEAPAGTAAGAEPAAEAEPTAGAQSPSASGSPGPGPASPADQEHAPAGAPEDAPAATAPPAEPAPPPRQETPTTGADFGYGQRLLDAGTVDRAAEAFRRAIAPLPSGRFTLQTMIACEAETVRKARAGTRPDAGLFVLPIAMKGRGCFRVMWGVFETRSEAEAARADLPKYFVSSGVSPAVVSLDRLRSSS